MPRDSDKDNDSRGRRDRGPAKGGPAKGRSGKPRGPDKKFAKRGPPGDKGDARPPEATATAARPARVNRSAAARRAMPRAAISATVRSSIAKTGPAKTGRAARIVASAASSRVAIGPSSRVKTVRFPIVRRATARSARSSPVATAHFLIVPRAMARSGRSSRAVIAPPMGVMTVRRAGIATIPVRPAEPVTRSLATSDLTRRVATVRNANSTASGSFRAVLRTAIAASAAI